MCANSAATRPRLSHTPERIFSIFCGDFSGNAAHRFSRPTLCSGNQGPTQRISAPSTLAMRRRLIRRNTTSPPTTRKPSTRSNARLTGSRNLSDRPLRAIFGLLERYDDLAEHLAAFEACKTALEVAKRHFGVDHRGQARRYLGEALTHVADGAAERADDAILLQIKLKQVDLRRLPGGRAAGDEPPAALEAQQRAVEGVRPDMLEGDVDAFLARELAHHALEALGAIVDDVVGAERFGLLDLFVIADRGEHGRTDRFRHFDRGRADARATGLHQDGFAPLELGVV